MSTMENMKAAALVDGEMFATEMLFYANVNVPNLDDEIANLRVDEESREQLKEWRQLAEKAYKEGQFDYGTALIKATFAVAVYAKHAVDAYPPARRDKRRQDGTRKPRRPKINEWIEQRLRANQSAKSPEIWNDAPEWITDDIGRERFGKRVTAVRKKIARSQVISD